MSDELVAEQIEVDPRVRAATLAAPEYAAVERTRRREVVHRHREMEPRRTLLGAHSGNT